MSPVTVTPQQVAAARLRVALDADDGRESDAWVVMLANAHFAPDSTSQKDGVASPTTRAAADALLEDALARRDEVLQQAAETSNRMVEEAEERKAAVLAELNTQRKKVSADIEQLRSFEGDYRSKLRGYIEQHLTQLDPKARTEADPRVVDLLNRMERDLQRMDADGPHQAQQ